MKRSLFFVAFTFLFILCSHSQNNVGIGIASPTSKLEVRGQKISYPLLTVSNDCDSFFDSIMVITERGRVGIGTAFPGPYMLNVQGAPSAFIPQIEVWDNDPLLPASRLIADINNVVGQIGSLNLYSAGIKTVQLRANGISFLNGGPLGIGTANPQEILHLNGAVIVGPASNPIPQIGTIQWNGANFQGFDGVNWINLGMQWDNDWVIVNPPVPPPNWMPIMYPLPPTPVAVSLPGYLPPVLPGQFANLYVNNMAPVPGAFGNQLLLDDISGLFDASMGFMITNFQQGGIIKRYSMGLYNPDGSFKITTGSALSPTAQGDGSSMLRVTDSPKFGIVDLPNQSRVRAYQDDPNQITKQTVPPNVWTPVNYNFSSPLPAGYDQHSEFTLVVWPNSNVPPEASYFTATEEGYYQVNARCEFRTDYYIDQMYIWNPVVLDTISYVSIAIYSGGAPGQTVPYAIGNNLEIGYYLSANRVGKLQYNNAPTVSDVVYLPAGSIISIWVYHTALTPLTLIQGLDKLYISIHKVS
jgi:hypothetical protein